jgi:hypothetical protein
MNDPDGSHIQNLFFLDRLSHCREQVAPAARDSVPGNHGDPFPLTNLVYQWNYVCPQPNGARCQATIGEANFTSQVISFDIYLFAFTNATFTSRSHRLATIMK